MSSAAWGFFCVWSWCGWVLAISGCGISIVLCFPGSVCALGSPPILVGAPVLRGHRGCSCACGSVALGLSLFGLWRGVASSGLAGCGWGPHVTPLQAWDPGIYLGLLGRGAPLPWLGLAVPLRSPVRAIVCAAPWGLHGGVSGLPCVCWCLQLLVLGFR